MSQISAKACVFDVFGTVLDWEGGLCRQLMTRAETKGIQNGAVDWLSFAHEWVIGHQQRACVTTAPVSGTQMDTDWP
jgi:hypothetical protein